MLCTTTTTLKAAARTTGQNVAGALDALAIVRAMADAQRDGVPNLVLIMTDQQRFDQIGYASGGHFETPNLDALAKRGVIFDAAYSASTVCVPARTALLTGLQP